jgi:hypothetical protein
LPLPGSAFGMIKSRRISDTNQLRHKAGSLIVRGQQCTCQRSDLGGRTTPEWRLEFDKVWVRFCFPI